MKGVRAVVLEPGEQNAAVGAGLRGAAAEDVRDVRVPVGADRRRHVLVRCVGNVEHERGDRGFDRQPFAGAEHRDVAYMELGPGCAGGGVDLGRRGRLLDRRLHEDDPARGVGRDLGGRGQKLHRVAGIARLEVFLDAGEGGLAVGVVVEEVGADDLRPWLRAHGFRIRAVGFCSRFAGSAGSEHH